MLFLQHQILLSAPTIFANKEPALFTSVDQSCPTLWDPMDCSTPGFPVYHQHPELTQTHVHRDSDVIQPSHPLSSLLLPPSIFTSIRVFSNESVHHISWPKYWSFSFSIILPLNIQDWLPLGLLFSISTTIFWVWATIIICLDFLPSLLFLPSPCFLVFHIITN